MNLNREFDVYVCVNGNKIYLGSAVASSVHSAKRQIISRNEHLLSTYKADHVPFTIDAQPSIQIINK